MITVESSPGREKKGESHEQRVFAGVAVNPCRAVSEDAAVEVLIEGFEDLVAENPIGGLESELPLLLERVSRVVDDLVEHR